jgi:hypothetical protein
VGASDWRYIEPWHGGVEETMAVLQKRVFAEYFSTWPEHGRPADIAELWSGDEYDEDTWAGFMNAEGTHTILDIRAFVPDETGELPAGTVMRPVPVPEIIEAFGHDKPTRAEFEELSDAAYSPLLEEIGGWMGRCVVLFRGGVPESVAFWGCSGD